MLSQSECNGLNGKDKVIIILPVEERHEPRFLLLRVLILDWMLNYFVPKMRSPASPSPGRM